MPIKLNRHQIAYYFAPKVACTSLKMLCYELETGREWSDSDWPGYEIHDYWVKIRGVPLEPKKGQFDYSHDSQWSFAVVRDPIKRLLSAFSNRVEYHADIHGRRWTSGVRYWRKGLKQLPDIEAFFKNFEAYREMNSVIRHHTNPQSVFLGPNLKKIDAIFKI